MLARSASLYSPFWLVVVLPGVDIFDGQPLFLDKGQRSVLRVSVSLMLVGRRLTHKCLLIQIILHRPRGGVGRQDEGIQFPHEGDGAGGAGYGSSFWVLGPLQEMIEGLEQRQVAHSVGSEVAD